MLPEDLPCSFMDWLGRCGVGSYWGKGVCKVLTQTSEVTSGVSPVAWDRVSPWPGSSPYTLGHLTPVLPGVHLSLTSLLLDLTPGPVSSADHEYSSHLQNKDLTVLTVPPWSLPRGFLHHCLGLLTLAGFCGQTC